MRLANVFAFVLAIVMCSYPARAQICQIIEQAEVNAAVPPTVAAIQEAFTADRAAIAAQIASAYQRILSAVKVDAAQTATNASQTATLTVNTHQSIASAMNAQDLADATLKAVEDFGPTGTSVDACNSSVTIKDAVAALSSYGTENAVVSMKRMDTSPGSTISGRDAVAARISLHRQKYCSQDEKTAGLCQSVGSGKDVDGSVLFDANASEADKDAFMNNLAGYPLSKPPAMELQTPEGQLAMVRAIRSEGLRSPGLASIAAIRSMNTGGAGSAGLQSDSDGQSVAQALDALISTYGGGSGFQAWHTELASKSDRGALLELNKLRALNMKLRSFRTESNTRIAAIFAALLAGEAQDAQ